MKNKALLRAVNGARIAEAVTNYGRAEVHAAPPIPETRSSLYHIGDEYFWHDVLVGRAEVGSRVEIPVPLLISEWVARVPGLCWTDSARQLRTLGQQKVERRGGDGASISLKPFGKSEVVSGGVGTLRLPPSENGYRLATLTGSANASAGVPVLIAPDVWDFHSLGEGVAVRVSAATWQAMSMNWASHFPSTRGIPRAYIRIEDPDAVHVEERGAAAEIHPFSIMRYDNGAAELFDFVFASVYSTDPGHRHEVSSFFDSYCRAEGRHGEYLIDADPATPMWNSRYHSPAEMRQAEALLQRRIEDAMFGRADLTEQLLGLLAQLSHGELQRLSADIGIQYATWFRGDSQAREAANLLERVPREQMAALIDGLRNLHPEMVH